jgi:basic membrane protein A and related proteins
MKKVLALVLPLLLFACTPGDDTQPTEVTSGGVTQVEDNRLIAMITDIGDIDDGSFNQGTWEGIKEFGEENNIPVKYYRPLEVSDNSYLDAIALAIEQDGADVVVTPGFLFEPAIYQAQALYPDVLFILIDGVPHAGDYATYEIAPNTLSVLFDEHESGFLAGYAAVKEGFTELGFMGGIAVPAVVRFGVGFVAGAHYAALQEGIDFSFADDRYIYLGDFAASDVHKVQASTWYLEGTEVIFAAAGAAGFSVMSAAEERDGWVIGVDVNQANQSDTVLTSAMKALGTAVKDGLGAWLAGTFEGGRTVYMNASNIGVELPFVASRFENFTLEEYLTIYALIKDQVEVPANHEELIQFAQKYGITTTDIPVKSTIGG